jgi:hypothetical protein
MAEGTSRRWVVTLAAVAVLLVIIGLPLLKVRLYERYENTLFQMRSIARAMAAYISAFDGAFPVCEHSLLKAGLMEEKKPGSFLVTAREPPGSVPPHAQGMWVKFHDFDVGWSGRPVDSWGTLIRSHRFGEKLEGESRSLSEMLWSLSRTHRRRVSTESLPASAPAP